MGMHVEIMGCRKNLLFLLWIVIVIYHIQICHWAWS